MNLQDVNERYYGIFSGVVVYNRDPNHLGRVQVRVAEVYGSKDDIKDELLPWAVVCSFFGGFYDGGSHTPYPVGSTVFVGFEQGDRLRPVVLGGVPKAPLPDGSLWEYGDKDTSMKEWASEVGQVDLPKEVRPDREETKAILFKTPKGATVIIEEQDEEEYLRVIDRSGQVLEMSSPVTAGANQANSEQRGDRSVLTGDQVSYSSLRSGGASIKAIDLAGQYIKMTAKQDEEKIEVHGCKRGGSDPQIVTITNTPGSEEIRVQDKDGQRIVMVSGGSDSYILLQSGSARIRIDGAQDRIWIDAGRVDINQPGPPGE